ncbi:MAG: DUF481 domain-containing protein [Acidobacteriia bacterium]|nr:DUF481 domain-containing protein [Terriglobia bacterium]
MNKTFVAGLLTLGLAFPAAADDAAKKLWAGTLGLSLLATTGNSDTRSFGLEFGLKRVPDPWGLDVTAKYLQSAKNGVTDAERTLASVRGTRALSDRWSVFIGVGGERDTFAGFDLRGILEGGATYKVLTGPVHEVALDGGLTWTKEDPVSGANRSFVGGILGAAYLWRLSKTSAFTEKLRWYPDFDETSDWRATSETALKASLTDVLALKAAYEVRYSNRPVPGFHKTDTASTVSLVASL